MAKQLLDTSYVDKVIREGLNFTKVATRPFNASCSHRIEKGEEYHVTYNPHRQTKCGKCWKEAS